MGFTDHSSHADPLACADGCDKQRVRLFQYLLEMGDHGDIDRDLLCGLVSPSDLAPAPQSFVAHGETHFKGSGRRLRLR